MDKLARMSAVIIALIILFISGALIIFFTYSAAAGSGGITSSTADSLCIFGTNGRDAVRVGGQEIFPELCTLRVGDLEADNLNDCPYFRDKLEDKEIKVNNENQDYVYSICATEQFLDLVRRCWFIRGAGKKDAGNLECFRATIKAPEDVNIKISTSAAGDYSPDFYFLKSHLKYNELYYSDILDKVDADEYWATHGGELIGTDWELLDKCMEKDENWAIYFEDKWISEEKDEIWVGCTLGCEDDDKSRHNCKLSGEEKSLAIWWAENIGVKQDLSTYPAIS